MVVFSSMIILLSVLLYFQSCYGYFVNIDAHGEECFHDRVSPGTRMSLMFEVADGGFLDIDVKVIKTLFYCIADCVYLIYTCTTFS